MVDAHICGMESTTNASYKCGNCNSTFSTMCRLCEHFTSHDPGGSFHFDNLLKVGFPKYDSTCKATQTDISASDELDAKALLLLKKKEQNVIPSIPILERAKSEEENARGVTKKDNSEMSKVVTIQQMAKKGRTLNQKKQKPRGKNTSVMKKLRQHNDFPGSQQGPATRSTSVIKRNRIKRPLVSGSSKEDTKKESNKNSGIVSEKRDKSAPEVLFFSNKEFKKTDETSEMEKELPKPEEFKETNLEEERASSSLSKYGTHSNNPTIPFQELVNRKEDNIVKVSQTWTPAIVVTESVQQKQMEPGLLSHSPIAVISTGEGQTRAETIETKSNTTVCEVCGKRVKKYCYKDHLNTHFGRVPYVCEICGKGVASKKALGMHKLCSHLEESLKKQCKYCDKKFPTKTRLEEHMLTHVKDKEFVCVKCGKVFFSKHALKRHVNRVHEEVKKFHQCPECSKKFKSKHHLMEHIRSHTQAFTCDDCGVSFNRLSSKRRHMKIHTGKKEHICHICGHEFIQKTPFWVHMEKHHDLTKEQLKTMFPSQHGGPTYTLPESIKQLEIQTHAEDINPSNDGSDYTIHVQIE